MKNTLIRIVKNNKFLYNFAKKINRRLNRIPPKKEYKYSDKTYYTYLLNNLNEIDKIEKHYNKIKNNKSELLIVIENDIISKDIHKLFRQYDNILFCDENYFRKYNKNFKCEKIILMDYNTEPNEFLKYIR